MVSVSLVLLFVFPLQPRSASFYHAMSQEFPRIPRYLMNPRQDEYRYLAEHPGHVYFPWNPLASLMVEGKLYHFSFGLADRELAGFRVRRHHFRSHIPPHLNQVALGQDDYVLDKYLWDFENRVIEPALRMNRVYMLDPHARSAMKGSVVDAHR